RPEGPEMYAHDIENFRDEGAMLPEISCATPTQMVRQQVKDAAGNWSDLTGPAWRLEWWPAGRFIFFDRTSTRWASCTLAQPQCGVMHAGQGLLSGEVIESCNKAYGLWLKDDGNLVLVAGPPAAGNVLWESQTAGLGIRAAVMKADGNFVLYSGDG